MKVKVIDQLIYAFAGEIETTKDDAYAIRVGLERVFASLVPKAETVGDLGKVAYERHAKTEGILRNRKVPPWDMISEDLQQAWMDGAWVAYMLGYEEGRKRA